MTHEEKVALWLTPLRSQSGSTERDFGVEVGAFETPVPGIRPFYVDRFAEFGGKRILADFWGDLCALPFRSHSLAYVVASHVLEHVANPVRALWECARVSRHDGILYLVVPDRRSTFDHTRPLTAAEHMIDDFDHGTTDCDATHLSDYLDGLDWSRWNPNGTGNQNAKIREELRTIYRADIAAGREINIHFHTFEAENFRRLIALINAHPKRPCELEIVDTAESFPADRKDGLLFVLRVRKPFRDRVASRLLEMRMSGRPEKSLLPDAKRFPQIAENTSMETNTVAANVPTVSHQSSPLESPTPSAIRGCIDTPNASEICDALCFRVEGWVHSDLGAPNEVQAWIGDHCIGSTVRFFVRPDVTTALHLAAETPTGFRLVARADRAISGEHELLLRARCGEASDFVTIARGRVCLGRHDHRQESFGILLEPTTIGIMRREHMYTTGPSRGEGSAEVLNLLLQYLPPTPCRIADVGCGLGWYGRELRNRGYDWLGLEMKAEDCAVMSQQGLPHKQVNGVTLPCTDGEFDAAMAVEVLEHIDDPRAFLQEVRRVSPRMLLISVPNAELLPYLHPYLTTPRHMLDSDHRSFFTRWSLGSLLREYYQNAEVLLHTRHPLTSVDGAPLFYNLFAIAWSK